MNVIYAIANDSINNGSDYIYDGLFFIVWNTYYKDKNNLYFFTNKTSIDQFTWLAIGYITI